MVTAMPEILVRDRWVPDELRYRLWQWSPRSELGRIIRECLQFLPGQLAAELVGRITSCVIVESSLAVVVIRHRDSPSRRGGPLIEDHGITSRKVVTNNGVGFIVDAFANSVELENMKYHGVGTSSQIEAAGDSALIAELTTQYSPDRTRATGTTEEGATANIYKTIATNTLDGAAVIEEHGLFSQAATGGGVLMDRSLTGTQTLSAADGIKTTYQLTFSAGG